MGVCSFSGVNPKRYGFPLVFEAIRLPIHLGGGAPRLGRTGVTSLTLT